MKFNKRYIFIILIYSILFLLLLGIRNFWDSFRFYKKGYELEKDNIMLSIRYYGDSIRSKPLIDYYSNKSKERLKELSKRSLPENILIMIEDELAR
jgi:hypothetical protein